MAPALVIGLLSIAFGGTHIGLAARPLRSRLVARLGEGGYRAVFTATAAVTFAALVRVYATVRFEGAAGLALATAPARWLLITAIGSGIVLLFLGIIAYPRTPMALFASRVGTPYGVERISRHPFFAGLAIVALAHVLLATRLVGAVLMSAIALLAIAGALHQDRKLLAERGRAYGEYLAATSFLPFAAVLAGRQRIVWSEIGWPM
ncbi:MAG: NnrU family protein, partial [Candidatus Binatia bacterium]